MNVVITLSRDSVLAEWIKIRAWKLGLTYLIPAYQDKTFVYHNVGKSVAIPGHKSMARLAEDDAVLSCLVVVTFCPPEAMDGQDR